MNYGWPAEELEADLDSADLEFTHVLIDANQYGDIRIDYQGETYEVVRKEDGLELEVRE